MNHKLVLLGDTSVGKSCIVGRLVRDVFYDFQEPTIGSAFTSQTIVTQDTIVKFDIWDTAGQERYRSLAPMYYRGAKVAVVVYDISNPDSLQGAKTWIRELKTRGAADLIIALVGNKLDAERRIARDLVADYATEQEILFFETSAKKDINIKQMFIEIANKIPVEIQINEMNDISFRVDEKNISPGCCYSSSMA